MTAIGVIRERAPGFEARLAIVLGSGLGGLADRVEDAIRIPYFDLPGFPESGVSGHAGALVLGRLSGLPVAILSGRAHYYETGDAAAMRGALDAVADLGAKAILLTNAAGSLKRDMPPGSIMMVTDHVNWSGMNPLIGMPGDNRFVAMTGAYDRRLRLLLMAEAQREEIALADGVYMWFSGPSFETPAEIRAARALGADAVGMSTVPEVILARFMGLKVAALSMITNFGAGMVDEDLSHQQTKDVAARGFETFAQLVGGFCRVIAEKGP